MALRLKRNGIVRVRPLLGGINQWMELQLPIEKMVLDPGPLLAPPATTEAGQSKPAATD